MIKGLPATKVTVQLPVPRPASQLLWAPVIMMKPCFITRFILTPLKQMRER